RGAGDPGGHGEHRVPPAAGAAGHDGRQPLHASAQAGGCRIRRGGEGPPGPDAGHLCRADPAGTPRLRGLHRGAARRVGSRIMTLASFDHVTRRYGDAIAVDDVTLDIGAGAIVGLLGPNGAGKTTLLSLLQGLRQPTTGKVELFGGNPLDARSRRALGTTPQETALPETLRVGEVIDYVGGHFG